MTFAFNVTPHSKTGFKPNELMFGGTHLHLSTIGLDEAHKKKISCIFQIGSADEILYCQHLGLNHLG